jgi:hypothetical protein
MLEYWNVGMVDRQAASRLNHLTHLTFLTYLTIQRFNDSPLPNFVPPHLRIHFLRPRINAAAQATDVLQAVPHEIGGRI